MPVPVNNSPAAMAQIDTTVVAATILNLLNGENDLAAPFSNQFTAPINQQQTSSVLVRTKPSLSLTDMPASRNGLLPRTDLTPGGFVEVGLDTDRYFKIGVDLQGVKPAQVSAEIGQAGAEAILAEANANLMSALVAQGTPVEYDEDAPGGYWGALLGLVTRQQEARYTSRFVLDITPSAWASFLSDPAVLRGNVDPRATAAQLLGVSAVRVAPIDGAVAILSHVDAVAHAKVLSGIRQAQEDFDQIVEGRIKVGTTVLDANAVLVLVDATPADADTTPAA